MKIKRISYDRIFTLISSDVQEKKKSDDLAEGWDWY